MNTRLQSIRSRGDAMKIMNKRLTRNVGVNLRKYLLVALIIIVGTAVFVAITCASDSILDAIDTLSQESICEDGYFTLNAPLDDAQQQTIENAGFRLESHDYLNIKIPEQNTVYRFYRLRKEMDLVQVKNGSLPAAEHELLMEQHFAASHGFRTGSSLEISGHAFQVSGIGYSIDYDSLYQDGDGPYPDYSGFCLCFLTDAAFDALAESCRTYHCFAYLAEPSADDAALQEILRTFKLPDGSNQLAGFVSKNDNQRIISFPHDTQTNKGCVLPMGIAFFVITAFLSATLALTDIRKQYSTIGSLYAMGFTAGELTGHYLILPVICTAAAALTGTGIGLLGVPFFEQNYQNGGCITDPPLSIHAYLPVFGILFPTLFSAAVNYVLIRLTISKPITALLSEAEQTKPPKSAGKHMGQNSLAMFRRRQFSRNRSMYALLTVSLSITIFMVVFGAVLYGTMRTFKNDCSHTIPYQYKTLCRCPSGEQYPNAEYAYERFFRTHADTVDLDFTVELIGIAPDSRYLGNCTAQCGADETVISSSISLKFDWHPGDQITLTDILNNEQRTLTVAGVTDFAYGMYLFTNLDAMRETYHLDKDYWNVVYSEEPLGLRDEIQLIELNKDSCIKGANARIDSLMVIIFALLFMGVFIFIAMLYMMLNILLSKWRKSIALLEIMGFSNPELRRMYLINSLIAVTISTAVSVPLSFRIVSVIFPHIISTIPNGIRVTYPPVLLFGTLLLIFGCWLAVYGIMNQKIKSVNYSAVLRSRSE